MPDQNTQEGDQSQQNAENSSTVNQNQDPPTPNAGGQADPSKTFTQDDVNRISGDVRKQAQKTGQAELLKTLGVDDVDALQTLITEAKTNRDASKTELELAQARLTELEPLQAQSQTLTTELEAHKTAINTHLEALKTELTIPDHVAPLLNGMGETEQLEYLTTNRSAFAKPNVPNSNAGNKGSAGSTATAADAEKRSAALRKKYRIQ